jgi:hypothetical protein
MMVQSGGPTPSELTDERLAAIAERWKGVYAVDGCGNVGINDLPPDIAALLAEIERLRAMSNPCACFKGRPEYGGCADLDCPCMCHEPED